ncbi:MAG TPA: hypothetical protein VMW69_02765 [Spirochaetia bacterium]|nr:hypothetical protein [Spirochaetia bacterium]
MQRLTWVAAFLAMAEFAFGAPATTTLAGLALWQQAVDLAGQNASSLPASVYTRVVVRDGSGSLKDSQETWSHLGVDGTGKVVTTVTRSIKDGQDNTANAQAQVNRNPERSRFEYSFLPMMPENQGKVQVTPTGTTRKVDGASCEGFSFVMVGDKGPRTVGTVWIDARNAAPRLMDFTFDPLPTGASEVKSELHFEITPKGGWHLASLSTYGVGQILFFRRSFQMEMTFSDYFQHVADNLASGTSP